MTNKRTQKKTCLIVCEGKADKSFLAFLQSYYQHTDWSFKIEKAGGDPQTVVIRAIKIGAGYTKVYCVSDNDTRITKRIPRSYSSIRLSPCLEGKLLLLKFSLSISQNIKSKFLEQFGREAQKITKEDWTRQISKEEIESWRQLDSELNSLIQAFENPA